MGGMISSAGQFALAPFIGKAQSEEAYAQAEAAIRNERLQAKQSREQAAFEIGRIKSAGTALGAEQRVAYTAAGVDPTVGTAAAVQADTAAQAALDAQTAKNNEAIAQWGFRQNIATIRRGNESKQGQIALGVGSSMVTSAANFIGSGMSYGK